MEDLIGRLVVKQSLVDHVSGRIQCFGLFILNNSTNFLDISFFVPADSELERCLSDSFHRNGVVQQILGPTEMKGINVPPLPSPIVAPPVEPPAGEPKRRGRRPRKFNMSGQETNVPKLGDAANEGGG